MEKFLVEMKTIEENDILEMTNIKESVKNLTESFQKEQLKSKILEQEFLTNALKSDFNVQQNEELDMKLYYYEKESQFLEAQAIKLSTDLETLKNEIKNKEEIQLNLTNQITNYQEIITQIENNNKIIKENFEMDISPLNIKKMGYKINKRPRSEQKSSFLDFLTVKKRLQAKQFKLKNKEFDLRKSNKEELLEIQRKTISLKLMGDSKKTCLINENEKILRNLHLEIDVIKNKSLNMENNSMNFIKESRNKALDLQYMKLQKNSLINDKEICYLDFKIQRMYKEMPILGEIFKDFKESISNQIENDLIFSQNDLMNRNSISQDLSSQIDNIKESIILIHKDSSEFNKAYREEIREINNIKFELHLLEKPGKITKEKSSEIEKRGSFNEDYKLNNLPSENSNFRANTIQTIDSQASFLNKKNKKKEFNCSVFQRQQNMKISDFECYQLKSKLNSLKEDHLLFSNFIDFRLNPSKYQKLNIDMPKTVESIHTNSLYSYKINNFAEICASDRAFNKSCLTIDNGSQAGIVVNQDQIDYLEENKEDIQRILDQEVIVSWGEKNGLLLRSFEYLIMFMSLVMNRVLNVAVLTKKRILF